MASTISVISALIRCPNSNLLAFLDWFDISLSYPLQIPISFDFAFSSASSKACIFLGALELPYKYTLASPSSRSFVAKSVLFDIVMVPKKFPFLSANKSSTVTSL